MKRHVLLWGPGIAGIMLIGCMSLDPFLFGGEKLDTCLFDSYGGEQECSDAIDSLEKYQQQGLVASYTADHIHHYSLSSGNETIAAVLVAPDTTLVNDTLIVYFHGKSQHIDYYWQRIRLLYATGYPVIAVDYRGFGMSTGSPDEQGLYEDGQAVLDFARENLGNPSVVIYGYSLGTMIAGEMASRTTNTAVIRLIFEAPIASIETIVDDAAYLNLPGHYVTTFTGDNLEKIKRVTVPFFWLHGAEDETLARKTHGVPLWEAYSGPLGISIKAIEATHRTVPRTVGYLRYVRAVEQFIESNGMLNFEPLFSDAPGIVWGIKE
ncbi:MAG: alpha/beta fold hydrolase [Chitinivibrionales bacterium]|nr:alpha/beta fold hydrolase [Chitinivibrionales bacterium]